MNLFSYIIRYDSGFAPNPFGKFCTLATCKPQIRNTAKKGDIILGFGSFENNLKHHLVYIMKVSEKLSFEKHYKVRHSHNEFALKDNHINDIESF